MKKQDSYSTTDNCSVVPNTKNNGPYHQLTNSDGSPMASATESRIPPTQSNSYAKKTSLKIAGKKSHMDHSLLEKGLNKRGYRQSKLVPGLWSHKWRPVQFTLVVDDFGVKYAGKEHVLHLKQTLKENYKVTLEWDGRQYIGITLDWDYLRR